MRTVCGEEIRALDSFTILVKDVKVNFACGALPQPDGGSAPECYEQNAATLGTALGPSECVQTNSAVERGRVLTSVETL